MFAYYFQTESCSNITCDFGQLGGMLIAYIYCIDPFKCTWYMVCVHMHLLGRGHLPGNFTLMTTSCTSLSYRSCAPVKSIKDIGSLLHPVWNFPAGEVGGRQWSLNEVEDYAFFEL